MKEATYTDQTGKIVCKTTFEAQNQKEANVMAQLHKKNTLEIQNADRVSSFVVSRVNVLKSIKSIIRKIDSLQLR